MQALRAWSFVRVLLVSGGWILLCVLAIVAWAFFRLRGLVAASSGSGGIGAVSGGFSELMLVISVAPAIVLIVAWLVAHWL
jgi:hypothetical protein